MVRFAIEAAGVLSRRVGPCVARYGRGVPESVFRRRFANVARDSVSAESGKSVRSPARDWGVALVRISPGAIALVAGVYSFAKIWGELPRSWDERAGRRNHGSGEVSEDGNVEAGSRSIAGEGLSGNKA